MTPTVEHYLNHRFGGICNGFDVVMTGLRCPVCRQGLTLAILDWEAEKLEASGALDWLTPDDVEVTCLMWMNAQDGSYTDKQHQQHRNTDAGEAEWRGLDEEAVHYLNRYFVVDWVCRPRPKIKTLELVYSPLAVEIAESALLPILPGMAKWRDPVISQIERKVATP